jgi:ankyrin repeat protein
MFSNIKIVELLIDNDANINVMDYYRNNILNLSCSYGNENYEIIEFLLKKGMDVDSYNDFGQTAFMNSCEHSKIEVAKILLKYNANINHQDDYYRTALMISCDDQNIDTTTLLLNTGADHDLKDLDGDTALFYACNVDNSYEKYEIIKLLLNYGADITTVDNNNRTLLEYGWLDIKTVKFLLENNTYCFLEKLRKPLKIKIEKILLDYGFVFYNFKN